MSFVLFVLGLAAAAAGVLLIGFGIPINEFSLGNTLIIAGTTVLSAGLVVLALAIAVRQLTKIADILSRSGGPGSGRSSDNLEPAPGGGRAGMSRSMQPAGADARGASYSDEPDFDQPRSPRPGGPARGAGFDPIEDVPLSPRTQPRIPGMGAPPPPPAPDAGQRGWRPPGARPSAPPPETPRHDPSIAAPERAPRPAPDAGFDTIWPSGPRAEPDFTAGPTAGPIAGSLPGASPRPNGDATHRDVPPLRPAADNAPVSVLKSGVVDGMAYTLYTDGSIEAELAQGVVRFGSIEELRNHLEKGA